MPKYKYGLMYKEELGGGAGLLYNSNGKDWLWDGWMYKKELVEVVL